MATITEATDFQAYLDKLEASLTPEEREYFVTSFSLHMKHLNSPQAFVVDLNNVVRSACSKSIILKM